MFGNDWTGTITPPIAGLVTPSPNHAGTSTLNSLQLFVQA